MELEYTLTCALIGACGYYRNSNSHYRASTLFSFMSLGAWGYYLHSDGIHQIQIPIIFLNIKQILKQITYQANNISIFSY